MLESLINERRHHDENNASMLDTMQQAIIRVLDRIDSLEVAQQEANAPQQATYAPVPMHSAEAEPAAHAYEPAEDHDSESDYGAAQPHAHAPEAPHGMFTPPPAPEAPASQGMSTSRCFDLDAPPRTDRDSAPSNHAMPDAPTQPVDALRSISSRMRTAAELKSQPDRHEAHPNPRPHRRNVAGARVRSAEAPQAPRHLPLAACAMSILTILAMIPAALFFMPRTPAHDRALPAAADLAMPTMDEPSPMAAPGTTDSTAPAAIPQAAPQDGEDSKPPADAAPASPPAPSKQSQRLVPDAQPGARVFEDVDAPAPAPDPKMRRLDSASLSPAASSPRRRSGVSGGPPRANGAAADAERDPGRADGQQQHVIGATAAIMPEDATDTETAPRLPPVTVGPYSLRLAAAKGDAAAQFEVASRIAEGRGADKDLKEAAHGISAPQSSGFALSQFRLGTFYERGPACERSRRAQVWYGRAAEQGNVKAMHNLAVISWDMVGRSRL